MLLLEKQLFCTSLENIRKFKHKYFLFFLEKGDLHVGVILNIWEIAICVSSKSREKKILFPILFFFFSCLPTKQKQRREYF